MESVFDGNWICFCFSFFTVKYHRYLKFYLFHKICWRIFWDKLGFSIWPSNWQLKKLWRSPVQTYWEHPCKFNSFICENSFSIFFICLYSLFGTYMFLHGKISAAISTSSISNLPFVSLMFFLTVSLFALWMAMKSLNELEELFEKKSSAWNSSLHSTSSFNVECNSYKNSTLFGNNFLWKYSITSDCFFQMKGVLCYQKLPWDYRTTFY